MNNYQNAINRVIKNVTHTPVDEGHIRLIMIFKNLSIFLDDFHAESLWKLVDAVVSENPDIVSRDQWLLALYQGTRAFMKTVGNMAPEEMQEYVQKLMAVVATVSRFESLQFSEKDIKGIIFLVEAPPTAHAARYYTKSITESLPILVEFTQGLKSPTTTLH